MEVVGFWSQKYITQKLAKVLKLNHKFILHGF